MGFGSLFGSIGKAVRRPFKDIHKAVKGTGGFMNRGFGKMTGGINKTGKTLTGRGGSKVSDAPSATPLADKAASVAPSGPPKVSGSVGKKPGEWKGSQYIGSGTKPEDTPAVKKKPGLFGKIKAQAGK